MAISRSVKSGARPAWGTLLRQSSAHENRNGTEVKSLTDESAAEFCGAMDELQQRIAVTLGRSLADIAIKPHMHTRGLAVNYAEATTDEEAYAPEGDLDECLLLSALRDAERLVGKGGAT